MSGSENGAPGAEDPRQEGPGPEDPGPEACLAAEYVLGTLEPVDHAAAGHRAMTDTDFAAEIAFWEARLAPLAMLAPAVPPPANLWTRIEDSTAGQAAAPSAQPAAAPPRAANSNTAWRAGTFAGFAIAAGLALFILLSPAGPPPPPPGQAGPPAPAVAVLTPYGAQTQLLIAYEQPGGGIAVRPNEAVRIPEGKDLELWQVPQGAKTPASLGVVPASGKTLPSGIAPGTTLLVSLEPKGGSPTGQPTGPVLFGGRLTRLN